jgi:chromosome partitioning protein
MEKKTVIAILNQKGGVGKTTITPNLGMGFKLKGKKVLLVDSDPQGSLRDWNDANGGTALPVIGLDRETLPIDLKSIKDLYDIIIIDAAPRSDKLAAAVIKTADIILIPVFPSPYDVWATADIVEVIKVRQSITGGSPQAFFIINGVRKNTTLSKDVLGAIKDYDLPNIEQTISYLEIFKKTPVKGETIYDFKKEERATKEFDNIINELLGIMDES